METQLPQQQDQNNRQILIRVNFQRIFIYGFKPFREFNS
jgi:hypothetical protein